MQALRFPPIPVGVYGFDELHAVFLTENRTRGHVRHSVAEIRGSLLVNKLWRILLGEEKEFPHLPTKSRREIWGTHLFGSGRVLEWRM